MNSHSSFIPDSDFCRHFGLACRSSDEQLTVFIDASSDISILDYLRYRCRGQITVRRVESVSSITEIEQSSHQGSKSGHTVEGLSAPAGEIVVDRVNRIIDTAIHERASDIHFEPAATELICRVRIDGILESRPSLAISSAAELVSRIKIMSGLDIAERRRPQDGSFRFASGGADVDIRVSVIPTDRGEKVVLRILDRRQLNLSISALGFEPSQQQQLMQALSVPNGMILITGPTGSGKTTTLYALLNHLKEAQVNISTVEDPIEYKLEGINQTQVRPAINLTFAAMLRALLRQDPNVIMVGEIRDRETIDIVIRAALTGHLVLSTVHTNSAVATITRLIDMGAEPYLLASSLRLIVAQRLVRRLCPYCNENRVARTNGTASQSIDVTEGRNLTGCVKCRHSGFSGRLAIGELLVLDDRLRSAINNHAGEQALLTLAKESGFKTMAQVAKNAIESHVTSNEEILREIGL